MGAECVDGAQWLKESIFLKLDPSAMKSTGSKRCLGVKRSDAWCDELVVSEMRCVFEVAGLVHEGHVNEAVFVCPLGSVKFVDAHLDSEFRAPDAGCVREAFDSEEKEE